MSDEDSEVKVSWLPIIGLFLCVTSLWFGSQYLYLLFDGYSLTSSDSAKGEFGDRFGAINALFSGLAFAGLIYAIFLQRKELEETRKELKGQKDALNLQNKTFLRQSFENTLFNMLTLHSNFIRSWEATFKKMYTDYVWFFDKETGSEQARLAEAYSKMYKERQAILSQYFRSLYRIFLFIHESKEITDDQKHFYSKIVRSQLANYELIILFYNFLYSPHAGNFTKLATDYALLNNLNPELVVGSGDDIQRLDVKIYGKEYPVKLQAYDTASRPSQSPS
ncbi:MAG TPA: putative phage abortive infection protein [Alphaproteobacteria bacterium]